MTPTRPGWRFAVDPSPEGRTIRGQRTHIAGGRRQAGSEALEHDGYCSMSCNQDSDCPMPPTRGKCGARGVCKRPE